MATPATIKIFLISGDPKGLRTAELSNWSGKALAGPRSQLDDFLGRDEAAGAGIYILAGRDPETDRSDQQCQGLRGEVESLAAR